MEHIGCSVTVYRVMWSLVMGEKYIFMVVVPYMVVT